MIMIRRQDSVILLLTVLFIVNIQGQFRSVLYPKGQQNILELDDDPGEPLFLTPYLEQSKIEEARRLR